MSLEIRAFVGPKYEPETSAYFFDYPTLLVAGSEMPAIAEGDHTLSTTLGSGVTSATVALDPDGPGTSLDVPTSGGFWVAGNGSGQAWEYISYSGITPGGDYLVTLTGCVREPSANREHNGVHTSGAVVKFFWELNTMSGGGFHYAKDANESASVIDWSGDTSGWIFPQAALRDMHTFTLVLREDAADPFLIEVIGFLQAPQGDIDYTEAAPWSVKINSASQVINRYRSRGMRRGEYSIANGANVQSSAQLGAWWKERDSGDYIEAEPDLGASSSIDGKKETLYISEKFVSGGGEPDYYTLSRETTPVIDHVSMDDPSIVTNTDVNGKKILLPDAAIITEFHLATAPGQGGGYRYIEIIALEDQRFDTGEVYLATEVDNQYLQIDLHLSQFLAGERLIICENEDKFRTENPAASPDYLIDLQKTEVPNLLKLRSLSGGAFGLYRANAGGNSWLQAIAWGSETEASINPGNTGTVTRTCSPALGTSSDGETYHYNWSADATIANNWDIGYTQTAGTTMDSKVWMLFELPPLGLLLGQDISDSYTGAIIITDGNEETTAGLALSSGSFDIQIGDEIMSANTRTATGVSITTRDVGGILSAHSKGDPIYISASGIAINALPVRAVKLVRDGTIVPADYTIRTTAYSYPPRTPDQENYTDDYGFSASVTGNSSQTSTYNFATTRRVRWLLIEFDAMSADPARARVNEVQILTDEDYQDSSTWLADTSTAAELAEQILTNIGFPSAAIQITTTPGSGNHGTAPAATWDVLTAYAEYAGLLVEVGKDSTISISTNSYWSADIYSTDHTWTLANARRVQPLKAPPNPVSQVKIKWQTEDGASSGTVVYPDTPDPTGEVLELAEQVYASEAAAQSRAEKTYWRKKFPYTWIVESATAQRTMKPGQFHMLTGWKLNSEMQAVNRSCLVRSVEHFIEQNEQTRNMEWRTTVTLEEIERFAE